MRSLAELQRNKEIKTRSQTIRIFLLSYLVFCHYQIKCLQDVQTALVWFHYHSKQESTRKNPTSRSHRQCTTQNSKKLTHTVQKQQKILCSTKMAQRVHSDNLTHHLFPKIVFTFFEHCLERVQYPSEQLYLFICQTSLQGTEQYFHGRLSFKEYYGK